MKESLKSELTKLKLQDLKLRQQILNKKEIINNGILSVVGQSLTPTIHKLGMSFGVKRMHTGHYKVHGKRYRTKKLAEKRWLKDCSLLQSSDEKKKGSLIENLFGGLGDMSGLILPVMYNFLKKKD